MNKPIHEDPPLTPPKKPAEGPPPEGDPADGKKPALAQRWVLPFPCGQQCGRWPDCTCAHMSGSVT